MKRYKNIHEYTIGDEIEVIDPGHTYTNYTAKFEEFGFKNMQSNPVAKHGTKAVIFGMGMHEDGFTEILTLRSKEGEYLMAITGIKPIIQETYSIY